MFRSVEYFHAICCNVLSIMLVDVNHEVDILASLRVGTFFTTEKLPHFLPQKYIDPIQLCRNMRSFC
jgi:hypothetical protein